MVQRLLKRVCKALLSVDSMEVTEGKLRDSTGRGGATKWEDRGSETFFGPPSRQRKTFHAPLLTSAKDQRVIVCNCQPLL